MTHPTGRNQSRRFASSRGLPLESRRTDSVQTNLRLPNYPQASIIKRHGLAIGLQLDPRPQISMAGYTYSQRVTSGLVLARFQALQVQANHQALRQGIATLHRGRPNPDLTAVRSVSRSQLTSIALAASTRLGQVLTLVTTVGFFLLGLLSDWLIARRISRIEEIEAAVTKAGGEVGAPGPCAASL